MSANIVEEFRAIEGWPDYEVSNLGRVRSMRRNIGRGRPKQEGIRYLTPRLFKRNGTVRSALVTLKDSGREWQIQISRLVLTAFVGIPGDKQEACHYPDSNPENNRLDNLRWGEHWENEQDKASQGMKQKRMTAEQVIEARRLCGEGLPQREIAKMFGVDPSAISRTVRLKSWAHIQ